MSRPKINLFGGFLRLAMVEDWFSRALVLADAYVCIHLCAGSSSDCSDCC